MLNLAWPTLTPALHEKPVLSRRRKLLVCLLSGLSSRLFAQAKILELNQATQAELESLPGLGPTLVERLLSERARAAFTDWADLHRRVRGIGPFTAKKLSASGLRVNGLPYPD